MVVGYPQLIPDQDPCPVIPRMRAVDYEGTVRVFTGINAYAESAARTTGSWFADLAPATTGHHVCSTEPWVRSPDAPHGTTTALMPLAAAQQAAARAVLDGIASR